MRTPDIPKNAIEGLLSGLSLAMAVAELLVEKGVISEDELLDRTAEWMDKNLGKTEDGGKG